MIINPYSYAAGYDSDAQAFFDVNTGLSSTEKDAVNDLVVQLKADSLWTKMHAIYPFIGGTADTHKWNLKDPRDLDAAFRITWSGGITHASTGVTGNGSTGWGNTFYTPSTDATLDDAHLSVYCRVDTTESGYSFASKTDNTFGYTGLAISWGGTVTYGLTQSNVADLGNYSDTDSRGFYMVTRRGSTDLEQYKNGTSKATNTAASTARSNRPLSLLAMNNNGTKESYSSKELALASVGLGMTGTQASNFFTAVEAYQDALSRGVVA